MKSRSRQESLSPKAAIGMHLSKAPSPELDTSGMMSNTRTLITTQREGGDESKREVENSKEVVAGDNVLPTDDIDIDKLEAEMNALGAPTTQIPESTEGTQ